jgi:hypothetical protein
MLVLFSVVLGLNGCAGNKAFTTAARAGDTVALAVGWNQNITRANLSATITPAVGSPVVYNPGDPNIRAVFNMYPDPVSRLVVGTETNQGLGYNANVHGASLNSLVTGEDKDWSQSMVLLNLPAGLATGTATIALSANATPVSTHQVQILSGVGSANLFEGPTGNLTAEQLATLERAGGSVVTFSGPTVPHSIYLELIRTPTVGVPWVANPRGDLKNIAWTDTGSMIKVIITPIGGQSLSQMMHFKFFVSGGVAGLGTGTLKAYDVNGNPVSGVAASVQPL